MKKNFTSYALVWLVFLAAFNAIVFLVRPIIPGYTISYDTRFWIAWACVIAAFLINLLCAAKAFRAKTAEKLFYRIPLISVSYRGLIFMTVLGGILMLIPGCPAWIAAVVCVIIAAFTVAAVAKADWAGEAVDAVQEKTKAKTQFIKLLTVDAESLQGNAKTAEAKAACKKVAEALRYSDPMSSPELTAVESEIQRKFSDFSAKVSAGEDTSALADELVDLIADQNRKCKALK